MEASAGLFPIASDVSVSEVDAGGVPADWVMVDGVSDADRVVLYFHGGAYVMGSRNTHRALAGHIARAAKARVLLPEYRLAPEHPFPAAVDDATACWRWLITAGYSPERMAIAGDSAGGGLNLASLLALKAAGDPLPACAVGLSPWTDLEGSNTREILLSDSTRFADKAEAAGVDVSLEIEAGLIHVWQMLPGVPEAQSAIERIGAFIERHC
jgi:acetyl esterase/lipase